MKVFFLDLWLDLKEKRLAPVAILLLAALVAVPFVVKKDEEPAPPPPTPATTATAAPAGPVVQSESTNIKNSRLTVFSPRDPFEPTATTAPASSSTSSTSSGTSTGTSTSTSTSTTTTPTTGSGTTGGGTTGSQPTTGTGNTTTTTKTVLFTYTTDLKFGESGDVKTYKNVRRLELVPSEKNPKLVFLGVTATAKTGVFLVDSNLGVETDEGRCRPSADECTFLYLRPDSEHDQAILTDSDGTVYHLRLLGINRVTVSSSNGTTNGNSNSGNSNGNTNSNQSPAFTGSAGSRSKNDETVPGETPPGEPSRPFSYPGFFADSADAPAK